MYTNMASSPMSLIVRLQNALNEPQLHLKCEEVGRILNESTSKDASFVLRTVVESVFGVNEQIGWGLRTVTLSAMSREFEQLRTFLGPSGPLLSLTYRLANDPFLMFEFPVAWLPAKSRAEIEEGSPGVFYANKVQNPGPGKVPTNILLNAFEFYIFHFTHFLISGSYQRWSLSWTTADDAIYPTLLEDYLRTFLPCDRSTPPGPPSPPISPRGVLSPVSPRSSGPTNANLYLTTLVSPIACRTVRSPGPHGYPGSEGSGAHASSPLHATRNPNPQLNIWTSRVLVQVLFEMWVNQCLPPSKSPGKAPSPSSPSAPNTSQSTALHACSVFSDHTPLEYRPNWHTNCFEVFVPSSDHVRVVRMLIKHLHFFANSAKSGQPSPLDDLRKNVWTMYRKSLFQFLHHTFNHWPLDSSFRLVLETWLSYIQPWRYTDYSPISRSPTQTSADTDTQRIVEGKWQGFIAENLLFYSFLFLNLMCRLFRLDLSAPKNAQILFRVTKVFSQTNLGAYIREIEEALEDPHFMHRSLLGTPHSLGSHGTCSGLQGDQFPARSLASVARAHILEKEGPSYSYNPMFSSASVILVDSLVKYIRRTHSFLVSELAVSGGISGEGTDTKSTKSGWWSSVTSFFEASSPSEGDTTTEDIRKTITHLDRAQRQLCTTFNLLQDLEPTVNDIGAGHGSASYAEGSMFSPQNGSPGSPEHVNTASGPVLTNFGRYQLMSGLQRRDLKYEGDPDLKLICTYEIPFLVRWLYVLSQMINVKYGASVSRLYSRQDLIGSLAKFLIKAPETVYEYSKNNSGSPHTRVAKKLPPRISLRFQASKYVLGYELAFLLIVYTFGLFGFLIKTTLIGGVLLTVPLYISRRYTVHSESTQQERGNQSSLRPCPGPEFR